MVGKVKSGTYYIAKCKTDTGKSLEVVVFKQLMKSPSVSSVKEC